MLGKTETPEQLHADHRHWKSELSMWRDDIELWKQEHLGAVKALRYTIDLLGKDKEVLAEHVTAIECIENSLDYHEKMLAEILKGHGDGDVDLDQALVERHADKEKEFCNQRAAHEQLKKRHHIAVAQVTSMLNALSSTGDAFG